MSNVFISIFIITHIPMNPSDSKSTKVDQQVNQIEQDPYSSWVVVEDNCSSSEQKKGRLDSFEAVEYNNIEIPSGQEGKAQTEKLQPTQANNQPISKPAEPSNSTETSVQAAKGGPGQTNEQREGATINHEKIYPLDRLSPKDPQTNENHPLQLQQNFEAPLAQQKNTSKPITENQIGTCDADTSKKIIIKPIERSVQMVAPENIFKIDYPHYGDFNEHKKNELQIISALEVVENGVFLSKTSTNYKIRYNTAEFSRRFSHFKALRNGLQKKFIGHIVPHLEESEKLKHLRKFMLEHFLQKMLSHKAFATDKLVRDFLEPHFNDVNRNDKASQAKSNGEFPTHF